MTTRHPPLVEFLDVSCRRRRESLLSSVTFAIHPGTIHAVVGPNGAGKSTLLSALLRQADFQGRILAHWRRDGRIGFVPQTFTVDTSVPITVEDFLALTRQRRPVCFGLRRSTRQRVAALLHAVGLDGLERRPLSVLSGGELRRVLVANAIDPGPELLVLDEPAAGLDDQANARLEALLQSLVQSGTTVLVVSHDLEQIARLAHRVTVLDRTVIKDGPVHDVLGPGADRQSSPARSGPSVAG